MSSSGPRGTRAAYSIVTPQPALLWHLCRFCDLYLQAMMTLVDWRGVEIPAESQIILLLETIVARDCPVTKQQPFITLTLALEWYYTLALYMKSTVSRCSVWCCNQTHNVRSEWMKCMRGVEELISDLAFALHAQITRLFSCKRLFIGLNIDWCFNLPSQLYINSYLVPVNI